MHHAEGQGSPKLTLAVGMGFEPMGAGAPPDYQSGALDHSAILEARPHGADFNNSLCLLCRKLIVVLMLLSMLLI